MLQVSNDLTVQVHKNQEHEFLMTTSEVAHGYDCSTDAILAAKKRNPNDLIEGKHFILTADKMSAVEDKGKDNLSLPTADKMTHPLIDKSHIKPNQIYWTKRGIIRLGFMLTSSRAISFRDWAEDLIISKLQSKYRLSLNNDEEKLFAIIKQSLVKGDIKAIANDLQLTPNHITEVKNARKRSHRVLEALVTKAKHNIDNNISNGYKNEFVQSSLQLFNL
jgi:hypothetical protein